jgi:hypothetical protein
MGVRRHVCAVFLMFALTPADGLICISCLVLVLVSGDRTQSPKRCLNKKKWWGNVQKLSNRSITISCAIFSVCPLYY